MKKSVLYGNEANQKLKKGVNTLADAVSISLGPCGKNVILDSEYGAPTITKDGVSIAKKISSSDVFENLGIRIMQEASSQTNSAVGDGTTTAIVLARAIYAEGIKSVVAGAKPIAIKRGADKALKVVLDSLSKQSKAIKKANQIKQIATISANGDEEIGELIATAVDKVGEHGVITVEEGKSTTTELKEVKGMQFDCGYSSPYFITNVQKQTAELASPYILIVKKKISAVKEVLPPLEVMRSEGRPLLIIAEEVVGEAMTALILNKLRVNLSIVVVKAPGFGDSRNDMLEDIATLTGGTVIDEERGYSLEKFNKTHFGRAEKVNVDKESTTIINGAGQKSAISSRINQINTLIQNTSSDYEKGKLESRRAKLSDGVVIIYVGSETEIETTEKKDRVDDATNATRAAIEKGIVPGGGVSLVHAARELDTLKKELSIQDQITGVNILQKALEAPLRTIAENAGAEGSVVLQKVREGREGAQDFGYDAAKGTYGFLYADGILDPLKVVEAALKSAVSVAGTLLTTDCIVVQAKDKNNENTGASPAIGRGMM